MYATQPSDPINTRSPDIVFLLFPNASLPSVEEVSAASYVALENVISKAGAAARPVAAPNKPLERIFTGLLRSKGFLWLACTDQAALYYSHAGACALLLPPCMCRGSRYPTGRLVRALDFPLSLSQAARCPCRAWGGGGPPCRAAVGVWVRRVTDPDGPAAGGVSRAWPRAEKPGIIDSGLQRKTRCSAHHARSLVAGCFQSAPPPTAHSNPKRGRRQRTPHLRVGGWEGGVSTTAATEGASGREGLGN